jgi:hypothetical protein
VVYICIHWRADEPAIVIIHLVPTSLLWYLVQFCDFCFHLSCQRYEGQRSVVVSPVEIAREMSGTRGRNAEVTFIPGMGLYPGTRLIPCRPGISLVLDQHGFMCNSRATRTKGYAIAHACTNLCVILIWTNHDVNLTVIEFIGLQLSSRLTGS